MDSSKINTKEQKTNQPVSLQNTTVQHLGDMLTVSKQQESGVKKVVDDVKAKFEHHTATPGPVIPQDFDIQEEGTKEQRAAKAEALNTK
jgi:hypothetical protein